MKFLIKEEQKEKLGFYLFSIASEPFFACALVVLIPIILEAMVSKNGFESDLITSCNIMKTEYKCKIKFLGYWINTTSFVLYVTAISVFIQMVLFFLISAMADYGKLRFKMLHIFGFIGGLSLISFLFVKDSKLYWALSSLTIIANVSFGASYVFYYAYLPVITNDDKEVVKLRDDLKKSEEHLKESNEIESEENLKKISNEVEEIEEVNTIRNKIKYDELNQLKNKVSNEISGKGFAYGYFASVFVLLLTLLFFLFVEHVTYNVQIATAFNGFWYVLFSIGSIKFLKDRKGLKLPLGENYFWFGIKQTFKLFSTIKKLPQLGLFLVAWFFLSDALHTIIHVAVLFSKTYLKLSHTELLIIAVITPLFAGIGNLIFNFIQKKYNISNKTIILVINVLYVLMILYCLLSLLPLSFGLRHKSEMFVLAAYHGFLLGPIQSFYRVQFSEIIPLGKENQFFGIYSITDKGSSWLGPLIIGLINHYKDSLKFGFFYVLLALFIPIILIYFFNDIKAKKQSSRYNLIN